jgi:hypothetical protein
MIIMPDTHQPTPVERLLDWKIAYTYYQVALEQVRPEYNPSQSQHSNQSQPTN